MCSAIKTVILVIAFSLTSGIVGVMESRAQPIDVYEPAIWERPVLIAHRGGVITGESSENSAAAVRLAAEHGFDMVEVDVRESKDHVPVAFHDNNMSGDTGVDARIEDLTLEQIETARYRGTGQQILTLDRYLALCARLDLGIMLDIKTDGSERFFRAIAALLERHQLGRSTVTFSRHPMAIQHLKGQVMFTVTEQEEESVRNGETVSLAGKFWFGLPRDISPEMVRKLQSHGALVIPAINILRYPSHKHMELARKAIMQMKSAGVDAYQLDAVYAKFFQTESR